MIGIVRETYVFPRGKNEREVIVGYWGGRGGSTSWDWGWGGVWSGSDRNGDSIEGALTKTRRGRVDQSVSSTGTTDRSRDHDCAKVFTTWDEIAVAF